MLDDVLSEIQESIEIKTKLKEQANQIIDVGLLMSNSINSGGKSVFFGNGGSAADAQHICAELVGKFQIKRRGLPSIAFTTNTSILTAIANDFGYDRVFERQVQSMVNANDVVIGLSTSGNSENVIRGLEAAKKIGAKTVGLTGIDGGRLPYVVDIVVKVPSNNTQRIQECHIMIGHLMCSIIEKELLDIGSD